MIPPWLLSRDANLVRLLLRSNGPVGLVHRVGFSRRRDQIPGGASRLRLRGVPCFERWGTALPDHNDHARSAPARRFCNRRRCVFSLPSPFPRHQSREKDVESLQWAGRLPRRWASERSRILQRPTTHSHLVHMPTDVHTCRIARSDAASRVLVGREPVFSPDRHRVKFSTSDSNTTPHGHVTLSGYPFQAGSVASAVRSRWGGGRGGNLRGRLPQRSRLP
jgi:hypothetical protein